MADNDQASQPTPFFSFWRPWIGWTAALGFSLQFVIFPILGATLAILGHPIALPAIDTTAILAMVTTTVGLGGMRTIEKLKGVHTK